jgi:conjugal transfer pilus assembly protein TraI
LERSTPPPDPQCTAQAWLADRGDWGRLLLRLAESIAAGDPGARGLRTQGTSLLIPYPEGLTGIEAGGGDGEPTRFLQSLWDAGLLLVDARRPLLRVREIDGHMWAVLTGEASAGLLACLGPDLGRALSVGTPAMESLAPEQTEAGARPEGAPAPAAPRKASPRGNLSRAIAEEIATLCEQGRVAVERGPDGRLIGTATLEALAAERGMPVSKLCPSGKAA